MITTLEKVKSVLQLNGTNKDATIVELISLTEEWIKDYCNITDIPPGYELIAIKMIEFNLNQKAGLQSEGLSRHSVSFSTDYPSSVTKGLRRKMRW